MGVIALEHIGSLSGTGNTDRNSDNDISGCVRVIGAVQLFSWRGS
jgi:hypothetical protein